MDNIPFRKHHLLSLLQEYDNQRLPLDVLMSHYFRAHTALGSKDRAYIAETAYTLVRWQTLLDHLSHPNRGWRFRIEALDSFNLEDYLDNPEIPLHIRYSFPKDLLQLIIASLGDAETRKFCLASNTAAPTTIRTNTLKTTREKLLQQLSSNYQIEPCTESPVGLRFFKKENFFIIPEFKDGWFEVQDEGSQLLADLVAAEPGQHVLDYCSGSGGKTLAIAPKMDHRGQLYLHDVRKRPLLEARKRLKRAGVQNAQIVESDSAKLKKMKRSMDWVLVDAPCSGTGTLRRNPDMKWKITPALIERFQGEQRTIFEKALSFMKPEGRIVYGTCSVLKQENDEQIAHFLKTYSLELVAPPLVTRPTIGGMDGFFGAVMKKK